MDAERGTAAERRIEAERRLLSALCQGTLDAEARREVLRRLERHRFAEPEHEVIFREASKLAAGEKELRRSELARRLTRAGFPDAALEQFFDCEPPRADDVLVLLAELEAD
jgi:replicative DNA helicase